MAVQLDIHVAITLSLTTTQLEKQLTVHGLLCHPTNSSECPSVSGPTLGSGGLGCSRQTTPAGLHTGQKDTKWGNWQDDCQQRSFHTENKTGWPDGGSWGSSFPESGQEWLLWARLEWMRRKQPWIWERGGIPGRENYEYRNAEMEITLAFEVAERKPMFGP